LPNKTGKEIDRLTVAADKVLELACSGNMCARHGERDAD